MFANWATTLIISGNLFYCVCTETAIILLSVQLLTQNLKFAAAISYQTAHMVMLTVRFRLRLTCLDCRLGNRAISHRVLCVFWTKNGFCNVEFWTWGLVEVDNCLTKPPTGTSLADSAHFELFSCRSVRVFLYRRPDEKWQYKVAERLLHLLAEISSLNQIQPKLAPG